MRNVKNATMFEKVWRTMEAMELKMKRGSDISKTCYICYCWNIYSRGKFESLCMCGFYL